MSEDPADEEFRASVVRERLIVARAASRHGVLAPRDLALLGVGANAVTLRVAQRRLTRLHRGALLLGPGPASFHARCAAAVLVTGGAVCGPSAAALHGYLRVPRGDVFVAVDSGARSRPGIDVRRGLIAEEVVDVAGIRVTDWPRTVIDCAAAGIGLRKLLIEIERAEGMLDVLAFRRAFARAPTRRGIVAVRRALAEHHPLGRYCRSDEEIALLYAIAAAGLPMPEVNSIVNGFEVDLCWREARVIVEVDGRQHGLLHQRGVDARRDAAHGREGFVVLRFTTHDIRNRLSECVAATRRALKLPLGGSF